MWRLVFSEWFGINFFSALSVVKAVVIGTNCASAAAVHFERACLVSGSALCRLGWVGWVGSGIRPQTWVILSKFVICDLWQAWSWIFKTVKWKKKNVQNWELPSDPRPNAVSPEPVRSFRTLYPIERTVMYLTRVALRLCFKAKFTFMIVVLSFLVRHM